MKYINIFYLGIPTIDNNSIFRLKRTLLWQKINEDKVVEIVPHTSEDILLTAIIDND